MIIIRKAVILNLFVGLKLPVCLAQTFSISFSIFEKNLLREEGGRCDNRNPIHATDYLIWSFKGLGIPQPNMKW